MGGSAYKDAVKCVAHDGRIVVIGFASGDWPKVQSSDLVGRSYAVIGAFMAARTGTQINQAKSELSKWVEQGLILPPVDKVFGFDEVPVLMQHLADGAMTGKMVLKGNVC